MINYNKAIFGETKCTPAETIARLKAENCFHNDCIVLFPDWFGAAELFEAINAGLLVTKTYKNCYSHTDYFLA